MNTMLLRSVLVLVLLLVAGAACTRDFSDTLGPEEGLVLAGKGNGKGGGGSGGSGGHVAGASSVLSAPDQLVTVVRDNKVDLAVSADTYTVATNFSSTVAEYGSNLNITLPNEGIPEGQPSGNCWLNGMDDPSAYDPSVTNEGIAAVLMNSLTYDGTLPRGIDMGFYKRELGNQHHNHAVGITHGGDFGGSILDVDGKLVDLSTNPVNHFRWGQNNPPSSDFLRVTLLSGNANKPSTIRVFELRDGMVRITGRLGTGAEDEIVSLACDVHPDDVAVVTVQPAP